MVQSSEAEGVDRERLQVLDLVWLATAMVVLLSVALPWFLRLADVDLVTVAWSVFVFATVYLVGSRLVRRLRPRAGAAATVLLQIVGVVFLVGVWHLVGGASQPAFLLVLTVPLVAVGILLPGPRAYVAALAAILGVWVLALAETPELRWYAERVGLPLPGAGLLPTIDAVAPFAGHEPPLAFLLSQLLIFAVAAAALILTTGAVRSLVVGLIRTVETSTIVAREAENLAQEVLRAAPIPALLVADDSGHVVDVSDSFVQRYLLSRAEIEGCRLLEVVEFSYPEVVEQLLEKGGGEIPFAVLRVGPETRVTRVRAVQLRRSDRRYVHVSLDDVTSHYCLELAVDCSDDGLLVLGADDELLYANRSARRALGDPAIGVEAAAVLGEADLPEGWWRLGDRERRVRRVMLGGQAWLVSSSLAPIPGENEALNVLTLRGVETPT